MSTVEESIPAHYVQGFRENLNMVPQQMTSRLIGCVDADLSYSEPGTSFNADDIGISTPAPVVGRAPASPEGFVEQTRRGGHFEGFNDGKWVDNADKARELADPSSKVTQAMLAGKYRFMDDKIIDAALGTAYSGQSLATSNSLPAAQVIAVDDRQNLHDAETVAASGNLGLTIGKIITAGYMLDAAELEGQRYFAFGAAEKAQLLASTPATSADYGMVKALVKGEINEFYGFTFVRTERLTVASSIADCIAWVKDAIAFRARPIVNAQITQRADRSYRWYAYYEAEHAAVRRYDTGVVKVRTSRV
jgi:hypothetical protein